MIRILDVDIIPLPLENGEVPPYLITGQPIKIEVDLIDNSWRNIYLGFSNWDNIKTQLNSWLDVYKY